MDQRLTEIRKGKTDNYLLPFFWQHEGHTEALPEAIQKIWESGCRAFCVESRPYEGFCGPKWWADMKIILEEAKKRDMKVWVLDDKHFPTGFANGLVRKKYPERRRWFLREHHVDVLGPMKGASLLVPPCGEEETLLSVCAYRRTGKEEELTGEPILFTIPTESRFLCFDVPEGCWRVFFIFRTRKGCSRGREYYIDMLSRESVQVLMEAVYEPHYEHFHEYFGNTLAGFFSDEPSLDCQHIGPWGQDKGSYCRTVGQPGVALPWSDEIIHRMEKHSIPHPASALPGLWYPIKGCSPSIRLAYMDTVTHLWRRNFSGQIGDWCRSHGVQYIGHIIEDMNAHARLGCSGGHFFRSLDGQDMSGIDIVLHQVIPGMADYRTSARISGGVADPDFFHYILAQLASSQARLNPRMKGRAMCEVFGAFGWAEGIPFMKWLMDFLLVRGINHFVPHAFSDKYPDPDCPPHFYGKGNDPQFAGFKKLMEYVNQVSHLLSDKERQVSGAVLYHAEAEWMNGEDCMMTQVPAKQLYDAQVDYDIVPLDALENAFAENGTMCINGHVYQFLAVPWAAVLPEKFWNAACRLHRCGLPVFFLDQAPSHKGELPGKVVPTEDFPEILFQLDLAHDYRARNHFLRIGFFRKMDGEKECSCFLLFNEAVHQDTEARILLPVCGDYLKLDLPGGTCYRGYTADGTVSVRLRPYQSEILIFDSFDESFPVQFQEEPEWVSQGVLPLPWDISRKEMGKDEEFIPYRTESNLFNITGPDGDPSFSGLIRYKVKFPLKEKKPLLLDLGEVGQTAQVFLNGQDLGIRICKPYCWNIGKEVKKGSNTLEIIVANTLVQRIPDPFSCYMQIPPSGLLGPVTLSSQR